MAMIICPRCEQSYISKVRIVPLNKIVYLCEECDALWESTTPISKTSYIDFSVYMKEYGFKGDWSLLEEISQ